MPYAENTVGIGHYGSTWRGLIEQTSQNWGANTSQVRVRGFAYNGGTSTSWSTASLYVGGSGGWSGSTSFSIGAKSTQTWIDQTFTCAHDGNGYCNVSFTIGFGSTGTSSIGGPSSVTCSMALDRIPKRPSPPGKPSFSNALPTSVTVSWAASNDNGGSGIDHYLLRYWPNQDGTGSYIDHSLANNLSRNVTGLTPGQYYRFVVYAHNGSADNSGYSYQSSANVIQMLAGAWLRISGTWKLAVPYINVAGVWKLAVPYIKSGGVWKMTS